MFGLDLMLLVDGRRTSALDVVGMFTGKFQGCDRPRDSPGVAKSDPAAGRFLRGRQLARVVGWTFQQPGWLE